MVRCDGPRDDHDASVTPYTDLPDDPASWSVKHVEQCVRIVALSMLTLCYRWLQQNDFASHMGVFREHKIDGPVLLSMNVRRISKLF